MSYKALEDFCVSQQIEYKKQEPMCLHTSFKIGGPADFFVLPDNTEKLCLLIKEIKALNIPYFVLGKGSNLLVSDKGIEGCVISLSKLDAITVSGEEITAFAGASLASVCVAAEQNSLSGMEFAYGIPGCVGGSLYMNAGAYGGEMSHIVKSATFIDEDGNQCEISLEDMLLGYRTSVFKKGDRIITSVTFKLKCGEKCEIRTAMDDYMNRRKSKQPLEYPSAGSTFKRPEGHFAGALIEKNNLKGTTVGGAMVSEKHAGFLINYNKATCKDVKNLMRLVKTTVLKADGIELEPEVIFIGRE